MHSSGSRNTKRPVALVCTPLCQPTIYNTRTLTPARTHARRHPPPHARHMRKGETSTRCSVRRPPTSSRLEALPAARSLTLADSADASDCPSMDILHSSTPTVTCSCGQALAAQARPLRDGSSPNLAWAGQPGASSLLPTYHSLGPRTRRTGRPQPSQRPAPHVRTLLQRQRLRQQPAVNPPEPLCSCGRSCCLACPLPVCKGCAERQRWRGADNPQLFQHLREWHKDDKLSAYALRGINAVRSPGCGEI
jgi:hypothetical protein